MKKITISIVFLFCTILGFSNAKLLLERSFAVTNDFFSAAFLFDDPSTNGLTFLTLQGQDGKVRIQQPARIIEGIGEFKFQIPSAMPEGWYKLSVFTKDKNNQEVLDLIQVDIPVYSFETKFTFEIDSPDTEDIAPCASSSSALLAQFQSYESVNDQKLIHNTNTKSAGQGLKREDRYNLYFELINFDDKTFPAFWNYDLQKVQGLRKASGNIFSLEVADINRPIKGQFISATAFGEVKFLEVKQVEEEFNLPTIEALVDPLPAFKAIGEYITRHKKRLKIMSLYEQEYTQEATTTDEIKDVQFFTKDYIQFNNTIEFINEVLQVAKYNTKKEKFSVLSEDKKFSKDAPLLVLNGRIVLAPQAITDIAYKDLETIEVIRLKKLLREQYSIFGKNGVVRAVAKLENKKSSGYDYVWQGFNKCALAFNSNGGPDFNESGITRNINQIAKDGSTDLLVMKLNRIGGKWQGETCLLER